MEFNNIYVIVGKSDKINNTLLLHKLNYLVNLLQDRISIKIFLEHFEVMEGEYIIYRDNDKIMIIAYTLSNISYLKERGKYNLCIEEFLSNIEEFLK